MYDICKVADTATDGGYTDARRLMHSQVIPSLSDSADTLLAHGSGANGSRQVNHQLNRISAFYTAPFTQEPISTDTGLADYPKVMVTDIDVTVVNSLYRPAIATATCSAAHNLSVGDETFMNVQETTTGTATSGSTTTLIDTSESDLNRPDDYYINSRLTITAGTNIGTVHTITDSDSSSYQLTFDTIGAAMDATSVYSLEKDY